MMAVINKDIRKQKVLKVGIENLFFFYHSVYIVVSLVLVCTASLPDQNQNESTKILYYETMHILNIAVCSILLELQLIHSLGLHRT